VGDGRSIIHSRVEGDLVPDKTVAPVASWTTTASAVYIAVKPASVSMPMDSKEPVSVGNRCAARAANGSEGRFRVAVCVLRITCPLGRETDIPSTTGLMSSSTAASGRAMKLPVVPVSALIEWVATEEEDSGSERFLLMKLF